MGSPLFVEVGGVQGKLKSKLIGVEENQKCIEDTIANTTEYHSAARVGVMFKTPDDEIKGLPKKIIFH